MLGSCPNRSHNKVLLQLRTIRFYREANDPQALRSKRSNQALVGAELEEVGELPEAAPVDAVRRAGDGAVLEQPAVVAEAVSRGVHPEVVVVTVDAVETRILMFVFCLRR